MLQGSGRRSWRSVALHERDAELAAVEVAVDHPGALVAILAPAGFGKSRLLEHATTRARAAGCLVLAAGCTALERPIAFGAARQLFAAELDAAGPDATARVLDGVARPARHLFRPGSETPPAPSGVAEGLYWLTESLAAGEHRDGHRRPGVVVLDDAHGSDEATMLFVSRLVGRLDALSLSLIVAARPAEPGSPAALADLADHPRATLLRPQALSPNAAGEIVRAAFPSADQAFADACAEVTAGNPFFLTALLDDLVDDGTAPSEASVSLVRRRVPAEVARTVPARVARVGGAARELAQALAVLGDGSPFDQVAKLAGLLGRDAEMACDDLVGADLLHPGTPLRFSHPLIGTALETAMPPFTLARFRRRAADVLASAGAPDEVVASQLLGARPDGDRWSAEVLLRAGQAATATGEHDAATAFLARAASEPPPADLDAQVALASAFAAVGAAEPGAHARLTELLDRFEDPMGQADALLALTRTEIFRGDFPAAAIHAEDGLGALDRSDATDSDATDSDATDSDATDTRTGQALLAGLLIATSRTADRRDEALRRFQPLVVATRRGHPPDDPVLCARLASRLASAGEDPALVRLVAERALADHPLVDPGEHGVAFAFTAAGLHWIDEDEWCERAATAALEASRKSGTQLGALAASHWLAACHLRAGRLDEAIVAGERSLAIASRGWGALAGWTRAVLASALVERGELEAAAAVADDVDDIDPGSLDRAFLLLARAQLRSAQGDHRRALDDAWAAGALADEIYHIDNPALLPWRSTAARAAACLGDAERACALAHEELAAARRLRLHHPLVTALVAAAEVTPGPNGEALALEAVTAAKAGPPLAEARSLLELGRRQLAAEQADAARSPLRRAIQLAESSRAEPLEERAAGLLRDAGGRRLRRSNDPGLRLTATQRRVASLAASGRTNTQIAHELYVTVKTVEWHLSQVYRELGISGREALGDCL